VGFDEAFLIPATGDRVPTVYVENHRVRGLDRNDPIRVSFDQPVGNEPTGREHPDLLKVHPSHGHDQTIVNGISRIGYMSGGAAARWVDEDMADVLTERAVSFMERHAEERFFLYFSTHDIHVPRVPHPRFVGSTGLGPRGDVITQLDWCVGQIVSALERLGLSGETLLIFTSDNGPVLDDGYEDQAVELQNGHAPAGALRGGKYSAFEAGTRVPFIVWWPGRVEAGRSEVLVSQVDLMASVAALVGEPLGDSDAPDSFDQLPALLGRTSDGRDHLVEHSAAGTLSLVRGHWKYIEPSTASRFNAWTQIELGNDPSPQLYNLLKDVGERTNVALAHPEVVREMSDFLLGIREQGRSRP
jgi:arylsulfatase A-like enzyme